MSHFFDVMDKLYPDQKNPDPNDKLKCISYLESLQMTNEGSKVYCLGALDRRINLRTMRFNAKMEGCVSSLQMIASIEMTIMAQTGEQPVSRKRKHMTDDQDHVDSLTDDKY